MDNTTTSTDSAIEAQRIMAQIDLQERTTQELIRLDRKMLKGKTNVDWAAVKTARAAIKATCREEFEASGWEEFEGFWQGHVMYWYGELTR